VFFWLASHCGIIVRHEQPETQPGSSQGRRIVVANVSREV